MAVHVEKAKSRPNVTYDDQGRPTTTNVEPEREPDLSLADINFDPEVACKKIGFELLPQKAGQDPQLARIMLADFIWDVAQEMKLNETQSLELTQIAAKKFDQMLIDIGEHATDPENLENLACPAPETGKLHQLPTRTPTPTPSPTPRKKSDAA